MESIAAGSVGEAIVALCCEQRKVTVGGKHEHELLEEGVAPCESSKPGISLDRAKAGG